MQRLQRYVSKFMQRKCNVYCQGVWKYRFIKYLLLKNFFDLSELSEGTGAGKHVSLALGQL